MFNFVAFTQSTLFFPAVYFVGIVSVMLFLIWGFRKNDNYQKRCKAVRRMKVNKIRRQYGQPALK